MSVNSLRVFYPGDVHRKLDCPCRQAEEDLKYPKQHISLPCILLDIGPKDPNMFPKTIVFDGYNVANWWNESKKLQI